jgi:hypothetical protein
MPAGRGAPTEFLLGLLLALGLPLFLGGLLWRLLLVFLLVVGFRHVAHLIRWGNARYGRGSVQFIEEATLVAWSDPPPG